MNAITQIKWFNLLSSEKLWICHFLQNYQIFNNWNNISVTYSTILVCLREWIVLNSKYAIWVSCIYIRVLTDGTHYQLNHCVVIISIYHLQKWRPRRENSGHANNYQLIKVMVLTGYIRSIFVYMSCWFYLFDRNKNR